MVETKHLPTKKNNKTLIFKCPGGEKISVVPDIMEMNKAIRDHLIEHKKLTRRPITEEILAREILKTLSQYYS